MVQIENAQKRLLCIFEELSNGNNLFKKTVAATEVQAGSLLQLICTS